MERSLLNDAVAQYDEAVQRVADQTRHDRQTCEARQARFAAYRGLVAEVNAITDSEMEMALLAR